MLLPCAEKKPSSINDREWFLPNRPVNPSIPGKLYRVSNASSLEKSLLICQGPLQNLNLASHRFRQHKYAVSADSERMVLQVEVLERDRASVFKAIFEPHLFGC